MSAFYPFGRLLLTWSSALAMSVGFSLPLQAVPGDAAKNSATRVLQFPTEVSLGRLTILKKGFNIVDRHLSGQPFCEARGRVVVPAGAQLMFNAADALCEHVAALDKLPPDALVAIEFERAAVGDAEVAHLGRLSGLRWLDLHESELSDKGLSSLAGLSELGFLDISRTTIKGQGFAALKNLKKLRFIDIGFNSLQADAFARLAEADMPVLVNLKSSANNATDQNLHYLTKFTSVTDLELADQKGLTDKCLPTLKVLKKLRILDLRKTRVTLRGLAALQGSSINSVAITVKSPKIDDKKFAEAHLPGVHISLDHERETDYSLFAPMHY